MNETTNALRTQAATRANMRKREERMARELMVRGWACFTPEMIEGRKMVRVQDGTRR